MIRNMSIKYKIGAMFFLVALIPMVLVLSVLIWQYNNAIVKRANQHMEENIRIMSDRVLEVMDHGVLCSNNLTLALNEVENDKTLTEAKRANQIHSLLVQNTVIFQGVDSIVYLDEKGNLYSSSSAFSDSRGSILQSESYRSLQGQNGKTLLFDQDDTVFHVENLDVITMGKHVFHITNGKSMGYLFINLDEAYVLETSKSDLSTYYLFDGNGNCVSHVVEGNPIEAADMLAKLYETKEKQLRVGNQTYLLAGENLKPYSWRIVGCTNLDKFNVSSKELVVLVLITEGITLALILLVMVVLTYLITRPIEKLSQGAERIAEGDMNVRFNFHTEDEIGRFGKTFNYMTRKNSELLERVDLEAKKKREYELALIQEQVKPHFLYNTLDIIIMLIDMNRGKEAMRVTKKLADYYKNTLSGSEEIVTISREVQITRDYLDLQLMRYGDKFTYDIQVDDELGEVAIPKMTLQPLVENAIYHGLKYREGWGNIKLTGEVKDDLAILVLEDDGIGMEPDTLEQLKKQFESRPEEIQKTRMGVRNEKKHFGVYAVGHRLQLYFGDSYGLDIESTYQVGTRITIRIPLYKESE